MLRFSDARLFARPLHPWSRIPLLAALKIQHKLTTDHPVSQHHVGVDRAGDISPRLFEDGGNAKEKGIALGINQYID
jgi:hypothetical protein